MVYAIYIKNKKCTLPKHPNCLRNHLFIYFNHICIRTYLKIFIIHLLDVSLQYHLCFTTMQSEQSASKAREQSLNRKHRQVITYSFLSIVLTCVECHMINYKYAPECNDVGCNTEAQPRFLIHSCTRGMYVTFQTYDKSHAKGF